MTLTVTITNSVISFAFFEGERALPPMLRIAAAPARTADEYAALLHAMPLPQQPQAVKVAVIASVVPLLTPELCRAVHLLYPDATCLTVGAGLKTGLTIRTDHPAEVGADLVAMAVGAVTLHKPPFLVLNLGDVTTLSAVLEEKGTPVYHGCAILPGAKLSATALKKEAALLSTVDLATPTHAIGKNTADSVRAGLLLGLSAAIERLCAAFEAETGVKMPLIATGEEAELILPLLERTAVYDSALAHKGLAHLALRNAKKTGNPTKRV